MSEDLPGLDCWYLTGATASGKNPVGIELAQRLGAEIISLDSMAIYRGMDIGTAKPTAAERQLAAHHLLDLIEVDEEYSVARYVADAERTIAEIRGRGREVLFVGGTPLYLKSLLRGLFDGPEADWEFRQEVEAEMRQVGQEALRDRLAQVDPLSAAKLHPNDTRRMIRALEVYKITGQPISHLQMQFEEGHSAEQCKVFVLDRPVAQLHERIDRRVDAMLTAGLAAEVQSLLVAGRPLGRTARQAVGYQEILEHLAGEQDLAEAVRRIKVRTRRFAKRQRTWFRGLSECRFVALAADDKAADVAEKIVASAG
jgi:tRNA dimethylallyltransferase